MLVAIIDDVLQSEYDAPLKSLSSYKVLDGKVKRIFRNRTVHGLSHSTICCGILLSANADLLHIQIFNDEKKANIEDLAVALDFCIQRKVDIINLSIGTTKLSDYWKIQSALWKVTAENVVIVAAQSNQNSITIPACLPDVIGVVSSKHKLECIKCVGKNRWGINLIVPLEKYIDYNIVRQERVKGNSYAVPVVISEICQYVKKVPDLPIKKICDLFLKQFQILSIGSINEEMRKKDTSPDKVPYIYLGNKALCRENIIEEIMNMFQKKYGIETICIVNNEKEDLRFIQYDKIWIKNDINNNFYSDVDLILVEFCEDLNSSIKKEIDITLMLEDNDYIFVEENEDGRIVDRADTISQVCDKIVDMLSV